MVNSSQYISFAVRVTPRSGRDEVIGRKTLEDATEVVCVRVTAPPDGGKANKAVCKLIASSLGCPKTAVQVLSGHTARRKQLGVDANVLSERVYQDWLKELPVL